jgi:hypothetical protein
MVGNEKDIDALLGKGEVLLAREEWEEAVHTFERAWEASGGGNRGVWVLLFLHSRELILESKSDTRAVIQGAAPVETVETERLLQGCFIFIFRRRQGGYPPEWRWICTRFL